MSTGASIGAAKKKKKKPELPRVSSVIGHTLSVLGNTTVINANPQELESAGLGDRRLSLVDLSTSRNKGDILKSLQLLEKNCKRLTINPKKGKLDEIAEDKNKRYKKDFV